ncbi:MAG: sigma-70 family RNA polymerase sigma factor [Fibrella sp.]|nr:sigma-70 family RNA polymerase sigma factor [Armatimonadota bacterium]
MTVPIAGAHASVSTDITGRSMPLSAMYASSAGAGGAPLASETDAESNTAENRDPDLGNYLNRLTRSALLSPEQEVVLAQRVRQGGSQAKMARAKLIEANMRLVIAVAKAYRSSGIALEDLIQEGAIGLMTATERFDWRRGYRFSTYATQWIRQAIGRAVDNKSKSIRLPAHVSESLRKIERIRAEYRRETGEEATADVIVSRTGMTLRKVTMLLQTLAEPVSLDMPVGDEDNTSLGSLLHDKSAPDPEEILVSAELRSEIHIILNTLDEREKVIMRKRFGFDGEETYVLQQIGEQLSISRERVRQIEASALRKLRTLARQRQLRDYLHG